MFQVRCPSCRRLLDVPEGSERATAVCPACGAAFVPAGGVYETAVTAETQARTVHRETGIQSAPSRPIPNLGVKSVSAELAVGLGYTDYQIAAKTFFGFCLLGTAIAGGMGDVSILARALPFAAIAAVHAILYARVVRGFRKGRHETRLWFYVVGSVLYVVALAAAALPDPAENLDDVLIGFLVTPLMGAIVGIVIWAIVINAAMVLVHGHLRTVMFDALLPDMIQEPSARRGAQNGPESDRPPREPPAGDRPDTDAAKSDPHGIRSR